MEIKLLYTVLFILTVTVGAINKLVVKWRISWIDLAIGIGLIATYCNMAARINMNTLINLSVMLFTASYAIRLHSSRKVLSVDLLIFACLTISGNYVTYQYEPAGIALVILGGSFMLLVIYKEAYGKLDTS